MPTYPRHSIVVLAVFAVATSLALYRSGTPPRASKQETRGLPPTPPTNAATANDSGGKAGEPACDPLSATGVFSDKVAELRRRTEALEIIRAFDAWLVEWRRSVPTDGIALGISGAKIAAERKRALKELIEIDPKRALESAVPPGLRRELPAAVAAELEERIDSRGNLEVSVWHRGAEARYDRVARIAGREYRAFVFGRRLRQASKSGLPLHGIVVDDVMAVDETPYRLLDDAEKAEAGIADATTAVYVAGERLEFASPSGFSEFETRLRAAESLPGPAVDEVRPAPRLRWRP